MTDEEIVLKRLKETLDVLKGKNVIGRLDFQIRDMVEDCIRVIEKQQKDIESWKKYCDEQENDITLKNNKICDLEFKIEKQSKEIEELKANKGYHLGFIDGGIAKRYEYEDKIKAEIEEYEKELNKLLQKEEWLEPHDTIKRNKYMHYIEFGQSLLEKE